MLAVLKLTLYVCLSSSFNIQFLDHFKSNSTSHFIKSKSGDFQKLLRYLSEIVTSVFKGVIGDSAGRGG